VWARPRGCRKVTTAGRVAGVIDDLLACANLFPFSLLCFKVPMSTILPVRNYVVIITMGWSLT
jgi:hypothetical protein